ncbi:hypothetical protein GCK72_007670 [Caenorhabditis remanei]|uniref:Uncharacterized protein n=1 Tax=Caenorhabditis remanei TaxID=31234 RepID=A0A6A5HKQ6_CAERE|nr:hypothetical protein GCK72_007670 [Caenorhabditis remanei]KAF1767711.1 hypothetical protein GCK72_007670 [Caenorhabditis remanei]
MSHQELRSVKPEPATPAVWERPLRLPLPPLPCEDPTRQMTIEEYLIIAKDPAKVEQSWKKIPDNGREKVDLMCVILYEISKSSGNLASKNQHTVKRVYIEVAVQVYKRTGRLLSDQAIMSCFRNAKAKLRQRLKRLIQDKRLTAEKVENELLNWPLYGSICFYRAYTHRFEQTLRHRNTKTNDGEHIVFDVSDDEEDDVSLPVQQKDNDSDDGIMIDTTPVMSVNLGRVKREPFSRRRSAPYSVEPKHERVYEYKPKGYLHQPASPQMPKMSSVPQMATMRYGGRDQLHQTPNSFRRDSMSSSISQDSEMKTLQDDLKFFNSHSIRVAKKNPGRIEKMREVLSATMLSFEWSNTDNLGDFFTQLGENIKKNKQGLH